MTRLWDKGAPLDSRVLAYTAGEDYSLDERLVAYDARASIAHAQMLHAQGLLSAADLEAIEDGLEALAAAHAQGAWRVELADEDGQTALERRLTARWRTHLDRREQDRDEEVLVALVGREVVGFAAVSASREAFAPWDAEITMAYVLKEHRGSGIGRGLMKASADHCIRRGLFSGGLWVLRDNGAARDFYEALEGEPTGRKADSVGGQIVQLAGYWWRDLATLAERQVSVILPGRY